MSKTINALPATIAPDNADWIPLWVTASAVTRKVSRLDLVGASLTGEGTIATGGYTLTLGASGTLNLGGYTLTLGGTGTLNLGGYTLTLPKTGTVPVGTGTAGRVAEWVTDSNTLQASTLAKTGAGVLTLSAGGAYTLTVPATGTATLGTGTSGRVAEWSGTNTVQDSTLAKSGAGVLTLSAGGAYTLTVPATGTATLGTGTSGRVAEWSGTNTVQASTLAKTGAGVLTLSAAGAYTLTVPATGTAALLATANAFTANQSIVGDLSVEGAVTIQGTEGADGLLYLYSDQGDDNLDKWRFRSVTVGSEAALAISTFSTGSWGSVLELYGSASAFRCKIPGSAYFQCTGDAQFDGMIYHPGLSLGTGTNAVYDGSGVLKKYSSSLRYKKNVQPATLGLNDILALRPITYYWNESSDILQHVGLIAEEVFDVDPRLVNLDAEDRPESLDQGALIAVLVAAIQELTARVAALEAH